MAVDCDCNKLEVVETTMLEVGAKKEEMKQVVVEMAMAVMVDEMGRVAMMVLVVVVVEVNKNRWLVEEEEMELVMHI